MTRPDKRFEERALRIYDQQWAAPRDVIVNTIASALSATWDEAIEAAAKDREFRARVAHALKHAAGKDEV